MKKKIYKLKSGKSITVREATIHDAQMLILLKRSYIKGSKTIPMFAEEYPDDIAKEVNLIKDFSKSKNSILLVAEYNNSLIGNIDLTGSKRLKMFHTGMIGMGIEEEWRNQGVGKILLQSILDWAKNDSPISLIWLDVYGSNELGINLYKNTGFKVSGKIESFFKDGQVYNDKIQMYQHI